MNRSFDDELGDILVRVDLTSSPGREPELSPELFGIEVSQTRPLTPQEENGAELRQGGSTCREHTLCIDNIPSYGCF